MAGPVMRPSSPVAGLSPENLRALIEDMGRGPGWYTSAELYGWYAGMVREEELQPVSKKMFGLQLKELGYRPGNRLMNGKLSRCWFITRRALRG